MFTKRNRHIPYDSEVHGLKLMSKAVLVPEVLDYGQDENGYFICLEKLERKPLNEKKLAETLVALHSIKGKRFGFEVDNYIGGSVQKNGWSDNWGQFFFENRLLYQLQIGSWAGQREIDILQSVKEELVQFLNKGAPEPSLVHGDLWNGNVYFPYLIDPAVYYGAKEVDLAMMELFGGFSQKFFSEYGKLTEVDELYETKREFYNAYHIFNHATLFGGGYISSSLSFLDKLGSKGLTSFL